jgi:hypothetical protein
MFKRPLPRKKYDNSTTQYVRLTSGLIYDLTKREVTCRPSTEKIFYYQNADIYLKLLEKNYNDLNIPFKKPQVFEIAAPNKQQNTHECHIGYPDRVVLKLNILKSGTVRVKLLASMACLWEKYYSKSKAPPPKTIVSVYKNMGYSTAFIEKLQNSFEKKKIMNERTQRVIDTIFEKVKKKKIPSTPKTAVKRRDDPEDEFDDVQPEEDEPNDDDDVQPEEDEGIVDDAEDDVEEDVGEDVDEDVDVD